MLLLEEYEIFRLGQKNFKIEMLFKDHVNNIQIRRYIPNIRFEQSGLYYMYYNQYLNKYEVKNTLDTNTYHFISILELRVNLEDGSIIINDYRKQQNADKNNNVDSQINAINNASDKDINKVDANKENVEIVSNEIKSNRGKRKKINTE